MAAERNADRMLSMAMQSIRSTSAPQSLNMTHSQTAAASQAIK
jgi:hypothetical protein